MDKSISEIERKLLLKESSQLYNEREFLNEAWAGKNYQYLNKNIPPLHVVKKDVYNLCSEFVKYMENRLAMGYLRYGAIATEERYNYCILKRLKEKLDSYESTKNLELLPDIANYALLEYKKRKTFNSEGYYFKSIDNMHKKLNRR